MVADVEAFIGGIESEEYRALFRGHAAGVALVVADPGDGPVAMTATSLLSVSSEPPLFVFSVSEFSSSTPSILRSETVVVHLLSASDLPLAVSCSTSGVDRFDGTHPWSRLPTGEPYFTGVGVWIRAKIVQRVSAGAATVVIASALEACGRIAAGPEDPHTPLVYYSRAWHTLTESSVVTTF